MVISVKTFKFEAWNKANKIIANIYNLVADIIMTLNFPHTSIVKCASIISNSAYTCIILYCKMFYTNMLIYCLDFCICLCVGVWKAACVFGCGSVWEFVNTSKQAPTCGHTQYKRGRTSNRGCPRFPIMPVPGAWEIANSINMFKTGPQMDNNVVFNCQKLLACKTK